MVLSDIHSLPILRGPSRTQLLPTLTFQFGSTFGRQLQRLCAELQVVLGSSLVLTPAANTDIHRNQTGLCRSSTGFGLCVPGKLTSPFSLARAGILPGPRRGKKKAFRSRVGGESTSPSPVFPWCLPGPAEKTSLPPFSDQRISRVLEGFPGGASGKKPACQRRRPKRHRIHEP